ncbi:MAG: Protein phosphatase 2C 1 [Piccolia ochrophora]|nr:MAG: Protein phosphatase 2C 1 [Piccolia ochrophora]
MFGSSSSSPPKEHDAQDSQTSANPQAAAGSRPDGTGPSLDPIGGEKRGNMTDLLPGRKSSDDESASGEKKRRSGSKASALLASAKNTLHLSSSNSGTGLEAQSPIQKLGKQDPALAVPQGPHNNSAGESLPGARSTFKVGVTEDKNKKCRRTMEDTHSYLYNFLSTPSPVIGSETASTSGKSLEEMSPTASNRSMPSLGNVIETDNGYFAIFDGHAGTFAADWCGKKLHGILEDAIRKNPNTPIPELLDQTFTSVDQQLDKLPLKNSGCTAVCAVLRWEDRVPNAHAATGSTAMAPAAAAAASIAAAVKSASDSTNGNSADQRNPSELAQIVDPSAPSHVKAAADSTAAQSSKAGVLTSQAKLHEAAERQRVLYTANVGDARIVLCRSGKALRLSYDHKGSDENEGKRISNAGGLILNNRVNGVLAVTRALGDAYMKDLVTGHPYTTETVVQPDVDEFIILACDGLWDVCSDQEAVDMIRSTMDPQAASRMLVDHALARFSTDNLSCMVVRFDSKALQNTVAHKAEPIGVEGDPPTKKGGISEAEALVLEARQRVRDVREEVNPETIVEETRGEPGPEMDPEGEKHLANR